MDSKAEQLMPSPTFFFLVVLGLAASLEVGAALAQDASTAESQYDCLIEPKSVVDLGTAEEGVISQVLVDRGQIVKVGDVIAELDSELETLQVKLRELRANNRVEILSSQARLKYRIIEMGRMEKLHSKSITSTKNLDEASIERDLAAYAVEAAKLDHRFAQVELKQAEARLKRRTVLSPVDGIVTEVSAAAGEFAHEQAIVATIAELNPLHVEVYLPVSLYGRVREGMNALVYPEQPIGGSYEAEVAVVDKVFDAASRTFGVRLILPNDDLRLPAGLRCKVAFAPGA